MASVLSRTEKGSEDGKPVPCTTKWHWHHMHNALRIETTPLEKVSGRRLFAVGFCELQQLGCKTENTYFRVASKQRTRVFWRFVQKYLSQLHALCIAPPKTFSTSKRICWPTFEGKSLGQDVGGRCERFFFLEVFVVLQSYLCANRLAALTAFHEKRRKITFRISQKVHGDLHSLWAAIEVRA